MKTASLCSGLLPSCTLQPQSGVTGEVSFRNHEKVERVASVCHPLSTTTSTTSAGLGPKNIHSAFVNVASDGERLKGDSCVPFSKGPLEAKIVTTAALEKKTYSNIVSN